MAKSVGIFIVITQLFLSVRSHSQSRIRGKIQKNIDGDTVWVCLDPNLHCYPDIEEAPLKIRMVGMDAPESHLVTSLGVVSQGKWGKLGHDGLLSLLPVGKPVDVEGTQVDAYHRTLARVYVNETDINLRMIRLGFAIPYFICQGASCNETYHIREKLAEYFKACDLARSEGLGIFDPMDPLREMPFEFRLRMQKRNPNKYVGNFDNKVLYAPADYNKVDPCRRVFFSSVKEANRLGYEFSSL